MFGESIARSFRMLFNLPNGYDAIHYLKNNEPDCVVAFYPLGGWEGRVRILDEQSVVQHVFDNTDYLKDFDKKFSSLNDRSFLTHAATYLPKINLDSVLNGKTISEITPEIKSEMGYDNFIVLPKNDYWNEYNKHKKDGLSLNHDKEKYYESLSNRNKADAEIIALFDSQIAKNEEMIEKSIREFFETALSSSTINEKITELDNEVTLETMRNLISREIC